MEKLEALKELIESVDGSKDREKYETPILPLQAEAQSELLLELHEKMKNKSRFKAGDLVTLDRSVCTNYKFPRPNQPALVLESLEKPLRDLNKDHSSHRFGHPCDTRLLIIHTDGEQIPHWYHHSELLKWENTEQP